MKPKTINILYWIFTLLFSGLMVFSAIDGVKPTDQSIKFLHDSLGYPVYFIQFISIAKIAGAVTILVPGLNRIKEWAYAGLFFDLAGAIYSGIAVGGFDPMMVFMLMWIVPGILSYVFWHKKINA